VRLSRSQIRRAGLGATAIALAVLWVASGITRSVAFPPTALAAALVRETPGGVATFFIELLGHWALRLAGVGALLAATVLGSEALRVTAAARSLRPGRAAALLVVAAGAAAATDPAGEVQPGPMAAALAAAAIAYAFGAKAVAAGFVEGHAVVDGDEFVDETALDPAPIDLGRRRVLKLGMGSAVAAALSGGVIGWIVRRAGGPDRDVAIAPAASPATLPARGSFPDISGLSPEITSAADHYVVDVNLVKPSVEADTWSLSVGGKVGVPLELSFEELQERYQIVEQYSVLSCISNEVGGPLVGHSLWRGVRLADVLDTAQVPGDAVDVVFRAADGYTDSITLETARDPSVLLAVAQNGEPLTRDHGFPCRVRVPALYGMKNVKWLESIEVVDSDYKGYWMKRGWSDVAIVRTQSRIDVAGEGRRATAGAGTWIAGVAWAGDRGISRVEVSTDGGDSWAEARLREPIEDELSWRQWAYRWTPEATGKATVVCRAVDGDGEVQTSRLASPHPAGATGHHSVDVDVS